MFPHPNQGSSPLWALGKDPKAAKPSPLASPPRALAQLLLGGQGDQIQAELLLRQLSR